MNFLKKLQKLPESTRKIILWLIVIIIGLALFILWAKNVQEKLKNFQGGGLKLPSLKEELKGTSNIEMPEISEEDLKKIEEEMKKLKEATTTENINF